MAKYNEIKRSLSKFLVENPEMQTSEVAKLFIGPLAKKRIVYHWIKQFKEFGTLDRKIASGRPVVIAHKGNITKIRKYFNHRSGSSQRSAAGRFGCSQQYISYILKKHTKVGHRKKLKRPLLSHVQRRQARPKCRRLYENYKKNLPCKFDSEVRGRLSIFYI